MNWKTGTLFAAGLAVGVAAGVAGVMSLGGDDEAPARAPATRTMGAAPAAAPAATPVAVAVHGPRCAELSPLLAKGPEGDGKESLQDASASEVPALLLKGKEAAAGERPRDAEVLFLNACRKAQASRDGELAAADAQYQLGRHYTNAAAFGAQRPKELYERANRLYSASLQIYQARHGASHEKTRYAREGLQTVQQVTGVLPPLAAPAPAVAQAKPAAPAPAVVAAAPPTVAPAPAAPDLARVQAEKAAQAERVAQAERIAQAERAQAERVAQAERAAQAERIAQAERAAQAERLAQAERARFEAERAAQAQKVAQAERARVEAERAAQAQRVAQAEQARVAAERAAQAERARLEAARVQAERVAQAERARAEAARMQAERLAQAQAAKAQAERVQAERIAQAQQAERAEAARVQAERVAQARRAQEEAARVQAQRAQAERVAQAEQAAQAARVAQAQRAQAAREQVAAAPVSPAPATRRTTSPSFNCAYARSVTEKLICGDEDLARMDRDLGRLHQQAKEAAPDRRAFQRASDAEWQKREATCRDTACLRNWYAQRRQDLSAAAAVQPRPAPVASTRRPQQRSAPRDIMLPPGTASGDIGTASGSPTAGMGSN